MVAKEFTRRTVGLASIPQIKVSTGAAQTARNLATVFGGLSNDLERQIDTDRERAGAKQGKLAAATGSPVLKNEDTIFGRAFDDAALSTYATRIQIQARRKMVEFEAEYGKRPAEFKKRTSGYIEGVAQEAQNLSPELSVLFKEQMGLIQGQAAGRIFKNFVALKKEEHEGAIQSLGDVLGHDLGLVSPGLLSQDPDKQAEALATIEAGMSQFDIALKEVGVDGAPKIKPKEAEKKKLELRNTVLERSIQGWFGSLDDRSDAAEQLIQGKFDDKNVQTIFDMLDNKSQQRIKSGLIRDESRLATIANREREEGRERRKIQSTGIVRDILFGEGTVEQKGILFDIIKNDPDIPTTTTERVDAFIRNGGRDDGVDVEANVLDLERQILNGELRTDIEIINEANKVGGISLNTIRQRLLGLAAGTQDKEFKAALDEGQAQLGYDKSAAAAGLFPDARRKGLLLQARMLKFNRDNKEKIKAGADPEKIEDVFEYMEKQVAVLSKTLNQTAAVGIPSMVSQYNAAKLSGDPKQIARAKANLTKVIVSAGVVDFLTASASGFDPIAAIDELAKKNRGAQ